MAKPPTKLPASRLQQDFELRRLLGEGAFGAVIRCRNKLDGKEYAIKITSDVIDTREIQNLVKLPTHENLVQYHTAWKDSFSSGELSQIKAKMGSGSHLSTPKGSSTLSVLCVQMELCGQDLRHWLAQVQSVDAQLSIEIFIQLLSGLNHIHTNNLIHRDLKPENIFFDRNNPSRVKIGDLGIATDHSATKSPRLHTAGVGTPLYLAPEQSKASYSKSVDIYALGIIFMELLCPSLQGGGNYERLIGAITDLKYKKIIPDSIKRKWPKAAGLIVDMVAVDPGERPNYESIRATFATGSSSRSSSSSGPSSRSKSSSSFAKKPPAPASRPQNSTAPPIVHTGISCNGCGAKDIKGVRYNCTTCTNYDLCETCERRTGIHPEDHTLLKMRTPKKRLPAMAGGNVGRHAADSGSNTPSYPSIPFLWPAAAAAPPSHANHQSHPFLYANHPFSGPAAAYPTYQDPLLAQLQFLNLSSVGQSQTHSLFDANDPDDDSSSAEDGDEVYGGGAVCNNCRESCTTWYQCDDCPRRTAGYFDLCGDCFHNDSSLRHPRSHNFTKFKSY